MKRFLIIFDQAYNLIIKFLIQINEKMTDEPLEYDYG